MRTVKISKISKISKLYVIMPVILLMALIAYPVAHVFHGGDDRYASEITEEYEVSTSGSVCSWGLKRGRNGSVPEVSKRDAEILLSGGGLYIGDINENKMYLTFDEGYENGLTEQILDVLKEENVRAIFFITGDYLKRNGDIVRRMLEEGHEVGNHTMNHFSMPGLDPVKCESEILELDSLFFEEFGEHMRMLRPPKGEYNAQVLGIAKKLNYKCIMWSFAYKDWLTNEQKGAEYAYKTITENFHNGAVLLLHAVSEDNAGALSSVIKEARKQGYEFGSPEDLSR